MGSPKHDLKKQADASTEVDPICLESADFCIGGRPDPALLELAPDKILEDVSLADAIMFGEIPYTSPRIRNDVLDEIREDLENGPITATFTDGMEITARMLEDRRLEFTVANSTPSGLFNVSASGEITFPTSLVISNNSERPEEQLRKLHTDFAIYRFSNRTPL